MNKFPLWKNLMVLIIVALSAIYAAPNFYAPDPAVQISHDDGVMDQAALDRATAALDKDSIGWFAAEVESNGVALIRLQEQNDQRRAQQVINLTLPKDYIVALNLAPTTPAWLERLGAKPMPLGLDLQGGVHFLMEVDMESAVSKQITDTITSMRNQLREERIRYRPPIDPDSQNRININFTDADSRSAASTLLRTSFPELLFSTDENGEIFELQAAMPPTAVQTLQSYAVQQNLTTLRSRVNELGVKEPKIQQMGPDRIIIELPGIQDTTRAKDLISAVATLEFHLVADAGAAATSTLEYDYNGTPVRLNEDIIVEGASVTSAQPSIDPQSSLPQVNISLDADGARQLNEVTRVSVGKSMAIVLKETKTRSVTVAAANGELVTTSEPVVEERLISVATIQSALGREFRITGLDSAEANDLALMIRSGALAAPMFTVEESTVGPSLGQENINNGLKSVLVGLGAMVVLMLGLYRVCGIAANLALFCNLLFMMAIMSILPATLTMPGIAGVVLTLGMAVDANVLIYARIRDELQAGMSVPRAIDAGFDRAFITILDSNLTTLIVAIILYSVGTGPVKGFAITMGIGILTSMFSSVTVTRALINLMYGGNNVKSISIGLKMPATKTA
ncbi:MAG: protein translocase subunit SecD [Pseudomonadota bacterium]